jgi:flagellar basal body-associated protein FliL
MATVALKTHDREAAAYLEANETLVKDAVVGTLASLSMEDLSRPDARERIKSLIAGRAGELVDHPDAFVVYLPEFVVQ